LSGQNLILSLIIQNIRYSLDSKQNRETIDMNDNYTLRLFLVKARSYGISERKNAFLNE